MVTHVFSLASSVAGRLPRINTREAIRYKDYVIPVNVSNPSQVRIIC